MRRGIWTVAVALAFATGGVAHAAVSKNSARASPEPAATAKKLIADCGAHHFETTVRITGADGKPQEKTVRMCGFKGQSDAEWIATLKDAVNKTADNPEIPAAAKDQIIVAVNAEIVKLLHPDLGIAAGPDISKLPKRNIVAAPVEPLSRDYGALPPMPTAPTVAPPHLLGADGAIAAAARLSLRCASAGDEDRPGSCDSIDKDTVLVLRADEPFPRGLAVRFVRHGDQRAELDLPPMKSGETTILRLPPRVCAGVVRSRLEIQAVGANAPSGTLAGTIGEYDLRC